MKPVLIIFCFLVFSARIYGQQNYAVSLIPDELRPYASGVVRDKEVSIEVKDPDNVIYHNKTAITVLNKNGENDAYIVIFYRKGTTIKNIKGVVYDEFGKQVSKFSESDFTDQSAVHDFSLFEDTRIKHYIPPATSYPYTIAYEYEVRTDQSLIFNTWAPNASPVTAVENSSFTFICKPGFNIRYKEVNVPEKATITTSSGLKTYTWKVSNLKAGRVEPFSPNSENYLTSVKIAPENFEYEGIKGSFTNWLELGKWDYDKLLLNRQFLPDETIAHIKALTADITDLKLKAKRIYEYMQEKTHYISVQVGIGGYQPFLASDVDKLGYGDCKALVNYTRALLKVVDIDSYYCVVEAGDRKTGMLPDFASMDQGDHVILCLPFKNDTTWLECTDQKIPFGYLGSFTDDRLVLACTPEGGKLMRTPKYTAQDNLKSLKANFTIDEKGKLSGDMETVFKGIQYRNREYLVDEAPAEQIKIIQKIYPINNLTIKNLALKQDKGLQPVTTENLKLEATDYGAQDNGKLFFSINPADRLAEAPPNVRNRRNDVYINDGFTDDDEITYNIPAGYKLARRPLNVTIDKPFGKFTTTIALRNGQLIYKRHLQFIDGTYSKDLYPDLIDFYNEVNNMDHYNVSLVKGN